MQYAYVIHFDAPEWCARTVASLQASEPEIAVVVVDNGGARLALLDGVEVIRPASNLGYTGGANTAIADWWSRSDATGPFVVCCHDITLAPGTLSAMADLLKQDASIGITAPSVVQSGVQAGGTVYGKFTSSRVGTVELCEWVSGACMAFSREAVAAVHGFDQGFGSYLEDVEICLRAADHGWRSARLGDFHGQGQGSASSTWRRQMYVNTVRLALVREGWVTALKRCAGLLAVGIRQWLVGTVRRSAADRHRGQARLAAMGSAVLLVGRGHSAMIPPPPEY